MNTNRKYICKKSIFRFKKGYSYYIVFYSTSYIIIRSVTENINLDESFNLYDYPDFISDLYFYDYFYSENEERKFKLQKILKS